MTNTDKRNRPGTFTLQGIPEIHHCQPRCEIMAAFRFCVLKPLQKLELGWKSGAAGIINLAESTVGVVDLWYQSALSQACQIEPAGRNEPVGRNHLCHTELHVGRTALQMIARRILTPSR